MNCPSVPAYPSSLRAYACVYACAIPLGIDRDAGTIGEGS